MKCVLGWVNEAIQLALVQLKRETRFKGVHFGISSSESKISVKISPFLMLCELILFNS